MTSAVPPLSILVVDDLEETAESTAEMLRLLGYDAHAAYSGAAALAACEQQQPDVAFLDLSMPGMDGYELAGRLRERFPFRRPLLIAVSGHPFDPVRGGRAEAGFDGYYVKPADVQVLQTLLQRFEPLLRSQSTNDAVL